MTHRLRATALVIGIGLGLAGCGSNTATTASTLADSSQPAETTIQTETTLTSTTLLNGPPEFVEGSIFPAPGWASDTVNDASDLIADVVFRPGDVNPAGVRDVLIRPFANAFPEDIAAFEAELQALGVDAEITVFSCPYTASDFGIVTDYLRSFEWSTTGGENLGDLQFAPAVAEVGRHGWARCPILFPLAQVSAEEVERIEQVALANNVQWIDFWAGPVTEQEGDPMGEPIGGLPSIRLPVQCPPSGCTGDESN